MIFRGENRYRVFATATYAGNPVTLYQTDSLDDEALMQQRARLSWSEDNGFFVAEATGSIRARFFSSQAELYLCGHGLLALAYHVATTGGSAGTREVRTPSGTWRLAFDPQQGPAAILPVLRGQEVEAGPHWIRQALSGMDPGPRTVQALHACPNGVWVARLRDLDEVLQIDAVRVATQRCGPEVPGALIAAVPLAGASYGFRYFAPWHGKLEDGGTGSAHCYLAPLFLKPDAAAVAVERTALQFSPHGIAEMRIALQGDQVRLAGTVHPQPLRS